MTLIPFFVICGLVCLFWLFAHSILACNLDSFKILAALFIFVFFVAAGDVLLGSVTGSKTISHLVILLSTPAVIPLTCLYLAHINRPLRFSLMHYIWFIIPLFFFYGRSYNQYD